MNGKTEAMAMYAGQSTGGIESVQPAATVVSELMEETQYANTEVEQLSR